jgi:RimJ/RimL family protein N-acetyltransferase
MLGPTLTGPRLGLEPPRAEQAAAYARWFADPEVTRYVLRRTPPSARQEEEWLEEMARSEHDVVWVLVLREGQTLIGMTGLHRIDWVSRHAWSGIVIGDPAHWGKGYATEAMRLRTAYAFTELGLEKLNTTVFAENEASRRALQHAGYRQAGLLRRNRWAGGRWHDEWLGEVLREEWGG